MSTTLSPRGVLIVFEGIDGAGKTTQARNLAASLRAQGLEVVESKEPTHGPAGKRLRESAATGRLSAEEELELFMLDRRDHVRELIEPGLRKGCVVIVDRYYFSTAAYQGARGMDFERILELNEEFAPQPDLLFILEVRPTVGRQRIASRGDTANHFEGEIELAASADIFHKIQRPYASHINGEHSIAEIQHAISYAASRIIEPKLVRATGPDLSAATALAATSDVLADESVSAEAKPAALLKRLGVRD